MKNLKRILCMLFILLLGFNSGLFPIMYSVYAADGVSGNYTYKLESDGNATITAYSGQEKNITIPTTLDGKNVTQIGNKTFQSNKTIQSVKIPAAIKVIGYNAFKECSNLQQVELEEGIEKINSNAFEKCAKIQSIYIPKTLTQVTFTYGGPFKDCSSLNNIKFAEGITKIPEGIFDNCTGLTKITIPETVETIGRYSFSDCKNLKEVNFGSKVTTIESAGFQRCSSLKNITIPKSVHTIDMDAFRECTGLQQVELKEGLETLGTRAFEACTKIQSIYVPKSLVKTSFNYGGPFKDCSSLNNIKFAEGITKIPEGIFDNCTGLTKITIPETVETIGRYSFSDCKNLKEVNFGSKVTTIESAGFQRCSSLKNITIPKSVHTIGMDAFKECTELEQVELQEGLERLESRAFEACTKIQSIYIPKTLTKATINYGGPFKDCSSLNNIKFAEGITKIPEGIFDNCTGLTKITIPETVDTIGRYSFSDCKNLKEVNFGSKVTTIESAGFQRCSSLKNVKIPKSVRTIDRDAFKECTELEQVELQEGLERLESRAFEACTKIQSIYVPKTLTKATINYGGPFKDCSNLNDIKFANGISKIPYGLFSDCNGLKNISIPDTVNEIEDYAFYKCINLETAFIPKNVIKCGENTFKESDVTVICDKYNECIKALINGDINIQLASEKYEDTDEKAIIKNESEYQINMNSSADGYIPIKITYSIKHNLFDEISDKKINIKIPKDMELHTSGIFLDSVNISNYKLDENKRILTIPIENQKGAVTLNLSVIEAAKIQSYAEISYNRNNKKYSDLIDVIIEEKQPITISAPEEVNTDKVKVIGVGPKGEDITISVDGEEDISVKTSETTGRYSAEVKVNDSMNYYETDITAKTKNENNDEVSATTTVRFNERTPAIKSFIMNYSDHSNQNINLIEYQNSRKALNFYPGKPVSFELEFENTSKVDKVYVVSIRNGVKKYLEATYNPSTKKYYASGFFDEENKRTYVPGVISYEYTLKKDESINQANVAVEDTIIYKAVKDAESRENLNIRKIETTSTDTKGTDLLERAKLSYENVKTEEFEITYGTNVFTEITGTDAFKTAKFIKTEISGIAKLDKNKQLESEMDILGAEMDVISTASTFTKYFTKDGKLSFNVDLSDPYSVTSFVYDMSSNKLITYTLGAGSDEVTAPFIEMLDGINKISPIFKVAKNYYGLDNKRDELFKKIMESDMTDEEKATALECASRLDTVRRIDFVFSSMFIMLGMADSDTWGLINACHDFIFDGMYAIAEGAILGEYSWISDFIAGVIVGAARITGTTFLLKWIIDPSGYVYEAVPNNKLEGVKCTIYYKEKEDSTPVLWNAEEYEQENPLYSDEEGKYAWDVPEGLWQVKYEKEGYETKYSEWLPVPPPQTDVNISLVSKQKPKVTNIHIYNSYIEIEFDKYMDITTLNSKAISIKDKNNKTVDFTVEYADKTLDENGKYLASKILLKPKSSLNEKEKYTIEINSNAKSYSDVAIDKYTYVTQVAKEPNIVCDENISLNLNEEKNVNVTLENIDSGTLKVTSSDGVIKLKENEVKINKGKATVSIQAIAKGSSIITLQVQDTKVSKNIYVTCGESELQKKISIQEENLNIGLGETYKLNPILYPTTLEQKFTYKSYDENIATINEKGEIKGIKEGKTTIAIQTIDEEVATSIEIQVIKAVNQAEYLKGDVNNDGKINARDAKLVLQYYTKKVTFDETQKLAGDVNDDNKINARDAKLILQYYTKKIKEF